MALQHLRSSTADKRPTPAAMSDGQLAMNTNLASPGLFLKDSNGDLVKVGPVHVGTTAPNATPAAGGQAGNSVGEQWLDTSSSRYVFKIWDGTAWRTEDGEFVNSSGDTMTGALVMDNQQQVRFRETTANGTNFIALQAPTSVASDKTITLPDVTGTVVTTGDTGSVTSTMLLDGTILNADVNASAAIAGTKIAPDFGSQTIATTGVFSHALGAAATPSVTFTGDLNTGIYSPGADQVAISTNAVERVEFGTGEVVFNDGGENYDFRIEGDTNSSLFFVDASAEAVGIGTTGPGAQLEINGGVSRTDYWTPAGKYSAKLGLVTGTDTDIYAGITGSYQAGTSANLILQARFSDSGTVNGVVLKNSTSDTGGLAICSLLATSGGAVETERARMDSSGRLLVGTSTARSNLFNASYSPFVQMETSGSLTERTLNLAYNNGGGSPGGPLLSFTTSRGSTTGSNAVVASGDELGGINFCGADGTRPISGAFIGAYVNGTPGTGDMPGRLVFSTSSDGASSPTERMRITSGGRLFVNTTTSLAGTYLAHFDSTTGGGIWARAAGAGDSVYTSQSTGDTVGYHYVGLNSAGTIVYAVLQSGNVQNTNNSYGAISDLKLKENIVDANSQWNDLKALQVRNYNLKEGQTHTQIGLVAQEAELVSPGLVSESPDRDAEGNDLGTVTKSVNYSVLYMKAVKALQEAMERIEVLEQRLTDADIA